MKLLRISAYPTLGILFYLPIHVGATNNFSTTAPLPEVVHVRKNCETLTNCSTTLSELQTWIDTYKKPNTVTPLLVDIGPGTFNGTINCNAYSNLSIRGAGQAQTVISGTPRFGAAISGTDCFNLNVQDLSLAGTSVLAPVIWNGTGSSTWTNVEIQPVSIYAWTEFHCPSDPAQAPVHRWFSSRLGGVGKTYEAYCSNNWFFGSQLYVSPVSGGDAQVLYGHGIGMFHVYGSNITVSLPLNYVANPLAITNGIASGVMAVDSEGNAEIHIHGTGIDIIGNGLPNSVAALVATSGGMIHANDTAYNLTTGPGGSVTRILNSGGHIHGPYLWEHIPDPVTTPNYTSANGADISTVTTGTSDGQPHLAIYSSNCASKWYDTVDKLCRP